MNGGALKYLGLIILCWNYSFNGLTQSKSILKHDTTWYAGGNPNGHVGVEMYFTKDSSTFYYLYIDDLWTRVTQGTFLISNDTVYLTCTTDCEDWKGSNLGPIVVENEPNVIDDSILFSFQSTAGEKVNNFTGKLINDPNGTNLMCRKYIEISYKDSVVYRKPLKNCNTKSVSVYIPVDMLDSKLVTFRRKIGIIRDGKIYFGEFALNYLPLNHQIEASTTKKKKKRKRK